MSDFEKYVPHAHFSVAAATLLLVIVGVWGVIETKGALEATQRAWVTPIGAQLTQQLEKDQGVRFGVIFVNPGHEPATDIAFRIKNYTIDSYDTQFTDMVDVTVPENTSCEGLSPIIGRTIIPPTGNLTGTLWSFDSRHGDPQFVVNDRMLDGSKFYVVTGCGVYNTYSKPHKTSFCYILQRQEVVQQSGPPNLLFSVAPLKI